MADNAPRKGSDFSVRVQVFPHTRTHSRTVHYLKAYRLRLKGDSTFAELGRLTLARYAKDDLESGCRARVGCISDERDCVVDMEERVNLIEPGEVLKLVLAPPRFPAPSSISNKDTGLASKSTIYPSQTPAVKNVRPRTPAVLLALTNKPSQSTQASTTATQNPKPLLKPMGAMPDQAGLIVARSSQCNGTGKKRDPYEIPSDSEHMNMSRGHNQAPSIQTQEPGNPMLIQSAMRVATRSTTSGVRTVSIKDFPASFDESQESSRNGSTTRGKCAAPHTINSHLSIVEDKVVSTNGDEVQPAYRVKTSRGIVPVFIRGMCSDTRSITNGVMTSSASSNKSMRSSKSSESIGPLTLTPSRLPQALNDYQDMLQYKIDKRDDETQRAAKQEAELKESRGKAKAQSRKNLPFATTSHLKSITKTTFHRKSSMPPIPDSFFAEPEYSDEDLDEIIHGGCPPRINESNDCHAPASTLSSQQSSTSTKSVRQTTYFNPINTLYPKPRSKPEARAPQKLGAGYSQRARDAFSDLDDDEDDNPSSSMCDTGTPEPFRRWMSNYETSFTCHLGFCSVADGPFEGLIRAGSQKGSYLPGYAPPSPTSVAQCEKTATPKDCPRDSDFSDYDSSAEHDVKENDSNFERLPIVIPESAKTTRSTESDSTSVLIMRQLSQDVPPSNQELGILMSSSPLQSGIYHAEKLARSSSVRLASANVVDASEVSPKPLSQADGSKISSNDPVLVGTPKSGRHSQHYDADLDVTPNFERALSQVETPSTRSRSSQKLAGQLESDYSNEVLRSTTGKVVVKIPELSAQRRAEYKKVAESLEQGPLAAPLRSFKEINGKLEDAHHFSQDSGVAAIDQVLKASPAWLANITEVMPRLLNTAEKTSHILGSQMNTTPDKIIVAACRKRKVDETKSQDPTYQPSRFNSHSDSSHQSKGYGSRKAAKKEVEATPGKASRETKFTSRTSVLEIPSKAAAVPVMELGTAANRSGLVSSTPVPPPSISDILEIIKDTPIKPTSHGQSSTIPPKYTSHFKQERHKTGQANKSHQRRKEETSRNDCELETTIDSTMSDDGSVSRLPEAFVVPMNLDYGPKKVYPNDMVTSGRASFPTDTVTRNVSQFTAAKSGGLPQSHNRKQRRRANRQLHRKIQIEKTVMSPNIYAPNVSINHLSAEDVITRHMSRHDKQAVQKQTREVKSSGYGDSPTLPPMIVDDTVIPILSAVPSQHQLLNSVEKMHQKKNRRHSPRSVKRKLMSPPITSRPSSAGSRI